MRLATTIAVLAALLVAGPGAYAQEMKSIPQSAEVSRPIDKVFNSIKSLFSNPVKNQFELLQADKATATIVAKRSRIDSATWNNWAYCKVPTLNILDTLKDGTVTVTVSLQKDSPNRTNVTVTPDFKGVYGLGDSQHTVDCQSKGVLEKDIFSAAGPQQSASSR